MPPQAASTPPQAAATRRPESVSVVVCAYTERRWPQIVAALDSLRRQTLPPTEIVLVVDHNAALAELVRASGLLDRPREDGPPAQLVGNTGPPGLSGARNSGVAAARGDVVAFLDDDAVAEPGWLAALMDGYRDPRILAVGGAIRPQWPGTRPRRFPPEFYWVFGCSYTGLPVRTSPVRNLIGANMSFLRPVLLELGGFAPALGRLAGRAAGCEETELCIRAHARWPDGMVVYEPRAVVRHHVPPTRLTWRYFAARCYAEGRSKATVVRLAGAAAGLASERAYSRRVLPRGVALGLRDALARRDWTGLGRAAAIAAGFAITASGYLLGSVSSARERAVGQHHGRRP